MHKSLTKEDVRTVIHEGLVSFFGDGHSVEEIDWAANNIAESVWEKVWNELRSIPS